MLIIAKAMESWPATLVGVLVFVSVFKIGRGGGYKGGKHLA